MAHLNLLPWREAQRKQQQTRFITYAVSACVTSFVGMLIVSMVYGAMVKGQQVRNKFLQDEIGILDQRIVEIKQLEEKKKNLQQRISLIAQLQTSRNLGTQIMDEVARVVPAGVYLSKLEKQGPTLLLVGKSESNNRLSAMIRSVESSTLLTEPLPELIEAGKDQTSTLSDFKMHARVKGYEAVQGDAKSKTNKDANKGAKPAPAPAKKNGVKG
jgi:type IV pilus assembly protein PilN